MNNDHLKQTTIGAQQNVEHHLKQTTIGAQQNVEHFILKLNNKDVIGLYISLKKSDSHLTDSGSRILKKIEDYLFNLLTIDQFANIEEFYSKI